MLDIAGSGVKESLDSIFSDAINGTVEEPTKTGFISLAKAGKAVWNSWRASRPQSGSETWAEVNFERCEFTEDMDFQGFQFGHFANFQGAIFKKKASFREAKFGHTANFVGTCFQDEAVFDLATFAEEAQFDGAQFAFGGSFSNSQFGADATFFGAQFGDLCDFDGASFQGAVSFQGSNWAVLGLRYGTDFDWKKNWAESQQMSPSIFESITFRGVRFGGEADFSNREFQGPATWEPLAGAPTLFLQVPKFHNCIFHQDTSFARARFPAPSGSDAAARAYRTLKLAAVKQEAKQEEHRFFRLEMAEEHHAASRQKFLYWAYAFFSDYGFSAFRPAMLLASTLAGSLLAYALLAQLTLCMPSPTCVFRREWLEFGLLNALPLPGFDKYAEGLRAALFPAEMAGVVQVLVTGMMLIQKALSLLAFFLLGLALRNLFKMK